MRFIYVSCFILCVATVFTGPCSAENRSAENLNPSSIPLPTVDNVDLARYQGKWFEIERLPTRFQRKCVEGSIADYQLNENGTVAVKNTCYKKDGWSSITGVARVVDATTRAKLKVKFFWFAPAGDYWILDLDPDYRWVMVGAPSRKFLWILSREAELDSVLVDQLKLKAKNLGFPVQSMIRSRSSE